jgi:hypothetical protein
VDVVKSDESDWEHWQEVIDKADAEDQILTALEVRPSSSSFIITTRNAPVQRNESIVIVFSLARPRLGRSFRSAR